MYNRLQFTKLSNTKLIKVVVFAACSSELNFKASVSTGDVSGQSWCAGNTADYQWISVDFGGERKITGKEKISYV